MPLQIVRNDITKMCVDAIVNTANPRPVIGSGTDHAIHKAAGPRLWDARQRIGQIPRGSSAITPGFDLPAKFVIHTVGTHWEDGYRGELAILRSCYDTALRLAVENGCQSIAFPLLASGNYAYPRQIAMDIASAAFQAFLSTHEELKIYLVVYGRDNYLLSKELFNDVKSYIDDAQTERPTANRREHRRFTPEGSLRSTLSLLDEARVYRDRVCTAEKSSPCENVTCAQPEYTPEEQPEDKPQVSQETLRQFIAAENPMEELQERVNAVDDTFSQALNRIIAKQALESAKVYNSVSISRQLFSKITGNPQYQPTKKTALLLAIGLHLNLDQTLDFIGKAGYTLSHSNPSDIIVEYFISRGEYNILTIDGALYDFNLPTMASCE